MGIFPPLTQLCFDLPKPALELRVCLVERQRRVDARFSAKVDAREQKIAQLGFELAVSRVEGRVVQGRCNRRPGIEMFSDFPQLLFNLRAGPAVSGQSNPTPAARS